MYVVSFFFFFFQAEDGIRDLYVTGVQTCALPICTTPVRQDEAMVVRTPGSRDPPTGPQPDQPGPVSGRRRRPDRGPSPPTAGTAPGGGSTPLRPSRPDGPRDAGEAAPPDRWSIFLVTPSTLLRWHSEL